MDTAPPTQDESAKLAGRKSAGRLADFIMFTQRSFLLNMSKELNKGNVSFSQFFLLGYLAKEDFLTVTDISRKMGHSTAAATGLVDRLEKLGYARRLDASGDRRLARAQITRKGLDLVEKMHEDIVENLVEVMEEIDGGDPSDVVRHKLSWDPLFAALDRFSQDFMESRDQPRQQDRDLDLLG